MTILAIILFIIGLRAFHYIETKRHTIRELGANLSDLYLACSLLISVSISMFIISLNPKGGSQGIVNIFVVTSIIVIGAMLSIVIINRVREKSENKKPATPQEENEVINISSYTAKLSETDKGYLLVVRYANGDEMKVNQTQYGQNLAENIEIRFHTSNSPLVAEEDEPTKLEEYLTILKGFIETNASKIQRGKCTYVLDRTNFNTQNIESIYIKEVLKTTVIESRPYKNKITRIETKKDYEQIALNYTEKYGIIDYHLEENKMYYKENVSQEGIYEVEVNLDTLIETRTCVKPEEIKEHQ